MKKIILLISVMMAFSVHAKSRYSQMLKMYQDSKVKPSLDTFYYNSVWQGRCVDEKSKAEFGLDGVQRMYMANIFVYFHYSTDELLGESKEGFIVRQAGDLTEASSEDIWQEHRKYRGEAQYKLKLNSMDTGFSVPYDYGISYSVGLKVYKTENKYFLLMHKRSQSSGQANTMCYFQMLESERKKAKKEQLSLNIK